MSLGRPRYTHNCQDVQWQGTNLSNPRNNPGDIAEHLPSENCNLVRCQPSLRRVR
jgi:hypothetical protein